MLESESVVERRGDGEQANGDGEGDVEEGGREQCRRGRAVYGLPRRRRAHPPAWHRASPDRVDLTRQPAPSLATALHSRVRLNTGLHATQQTSIYSTTMQNNTQTLSFEFEIPKFKAQVDVREPPFSEFTRRECLAAT